MLPDIPVLLLVSGNKDKETGQSPQLEELIAVAKAAGVDGLNLDVRFPIDQSVMKQVHRAGLKLYVWTVNDADQARRLAAAGVDGITTDRPGWLREQLEK